jgi:hypothetical protein
MANDSDSDTDLPPPLIPDSDMDNYDTKDTDFILRIIRPDENTSLAAAQTIDTPPLCPPIHVPTDDELNNSHRQFNFGNTNPPTCVPPDLRRPHGHQ